MANLELVALAVRDYGLAIRFFHQLQERAEVKRVMGPRG